MVNDRSTQPRPEKETGLGRRVGLHRAVIIEMITRQIRKHSAIDLAAGHTAFFESDRRGFDSTRRGAIANEVGQQVGILRRIWRRETGLDHHPRITGAQRTNDGTVPGHRLRQPLRDRRFTIRSRNGQHPQLATWVAIHLLRDWSDQLM